jgi:cobalt-precorrin-5B (C1)-methyltransferase
MFYKTAMSKVEREHRPEGELRRGWTTGACATAATKAALSALLTGKFPDPVTIRLPRGETPAFPLALEETGPDFARAGIVKDAGDDPDVTHGATIIATVRPGRPQTGVTFVAGEGVGTVTRPGLPVAPGEAAINPVPRSMMSDVVQALCSQTGAAPDFEIEISVPDGARIAQRTWNPRLGIVGGISILGTTGIVHPYSCSAWIHSIRRGIDVCRANGVTHALAATGSTSESAAAVLYRFPEIALLDMGDFAGGLLKYLREHPLPRLTIAGGFAKMAKLAKGFLDLHSARSQVDMDWLAEIADSAGGNDVLHRAIAGANTANEALALADAEHIDLAGPIARRARLAALDVLREAPVQVETMVVSRDGRILARAGRFHD